MKYFLKKYAIVVWLGVVFGIIFLLPKPGELETRSSVFCAYGKVFVEFEEGNKRWGTILLNDGGKPIPCDDTTKMPVINLEKNNVI